MRKSFKHTATNTCKLIRKFRTKNQKAFEVAGKVALLSYSSLIDKIIYKMDDYTALSDDSFDDFKVSGSCQENRTVKLRFKILEFYRVMLLRRFNNFD